MLIACPTCDTSYDVDAEKLGEGRPVRCRRCRTQWVAIAAAMPDPALPVSETGDPALTLDVDSLSYKSLRGSVGVEVRGDLGDEGYSFRPYGSLAVEKDFIGDERAVRFAQTSAPTIVNSFALEDGSKDAYGRFSAGFSASVFDNVSVDAAASATFGKDQGDETSGHLGLRIGF